MQKADIIIATMGVVALLATTLGVVFYEEVSGEQDIDFSEMERSLGSGSGDVTSATDFGFTAGDNATMASFDVTVNFAGQAANGGTAQISVEVTDPNGTVTAKQFTLSIAQGGTSASGTYTVDVPRFYMMPGHTHTADLDGFDMSHMWSEGYNVRVSVTAPESNTVVPVVGAGVSYTFNADVSGTETYFRHHLSAHDGDDVEAI